MSLDIQAAINWAMSQVGYHEDDSGNTPWSDRWGFPYGAWCGMYYQSAIEAGGGTVGDGGNVPHTHYTPDGAQGFADWGLWTTVPQPGDAIYFDWDSEGLDGPKYNIDHIGMVVNADNWPDYVETVEGNISNSVVNTIRYNNGQIVGFGRPRGAAVAPEPKPIPQPQPEPQAPITEEDDALNIYVGGNGKGAWFLQAGGKLIPISKGDVTLKQRPAVNVVYCTDAFIQRLAKTLPVAR